YDERDDRSVVGRVRRAHRSVRVEPDAARELPPQSRQRLVGAAHGLVIGSGRDRAAALDGAEGLLAGAQAVTAHNGADGHAGGGGGGGGEGGGGGGEGGAEGGAEGVSSMGVAMRGTGGTAGADVVVRGGATAGPRSVVVGGRRRGRLSSAVGGSAARSTGASS